MLFFAPEGMVSGGEYVILCCGSQKVYLDFETGNLREAGFHFVPLSENKKN